MIFIIIGQLFLITINSIKCYRTKKSGNFPDFFDDFFLKIYTSTSDSLAAR